MDEKLILIEGWFFSMPAVLSDRQSYQINIG